MYVIQKLAKNRVQFHLLFWYMQSPYMDTYERKISVRIAGQNDFKRVRDSMFDS
jgi:hypothetical protein